MKRLVTVLIALLLSLCAAVAGKSSTSELKTGDAMQEIRQQYAAINRRMARYKKVKKELSGFSLEGGELIAHFDGRAIVKIVANHYGESGKALEEFYYADGNLIFVFRKDFTYNRPLTGRVVKTTESRFYFQNNRLIRWINEDGKQVPSNSPEFEQTQNDYLDSSRKFVDGARSKSSTIEAE